jgi:predicted Zn-dependent protease
VARSTGPEAQPPEAQPPEAQSPKAQSPKAEPAQGFVKSQSWRRSLLELGALAAILAIVFFAGRALIGCVAEAVVSELPFEIDQRIGTTAAEQMRLKYGTGAAPTPEQVKRVEAIFDGLARALDADERGVIRTRRVTVVSDDQVNAFALPGGEVFVLTGLLDRVGGDDDMLRGVLAHELGHAVKRHGMRSLARSAAFSVVIAALIGNVDDLVVTLSAGASKLDGLSHSRDMESEADAFAVDVLRRAGHDPSGLWRFLESLESQPVPELLSTHPDPLERARRLREQARERGVEPAAE